MSIEGRTERELRRYLMDRVRIGDRYRLRLKREAEAGGFRYMRADWYTLTGLYRHMVMFESEKGTRICFPFYEAIHLLRGAAQTDGKYPGSALVPESAKRHTREDLRGAR